MKKLLMVVLALAIGLTLSACSSDKAVVGLEKIKANGKIVVYTDPNFPPFEFLGADGVKGVDIEIAKAIAADLGVTVELKEAEFDSILMALKGGKGDIAVSGFTITEERKQSVDFSNAYINSVQYLILPPKSTINVLEDLAGKNVGVAKGYTGQLLLNDEIGEGGVLNGKGVELKEYNSAMEAMLDLKNGRIAAIVMDEYVAKNIASKNPGFSVKELRYDNGNLASEEYGVAVPKGNPELLEKINAVINRLSQEGKISEWVVKFAE